MATQISLQTLLESGAHFGHQSRRWNPKIEPFIYGVQEGVHVFDLTKTKEKLEEALDFLKKTSNEGKTILFLGSKKQAKTKTKEIAEEVGAPYVNERWLGGTLTNFEQMRRSCKKLADMKTKRSAGEYKRFTKKERLLIDREIERLERFFGGVVGMEALPDVLVVVDIKREHAAVSEAKKTKVATVGIVDSNSDPSQVDYPIPMNDDATRAVEYVLELFKKAILEGKKTKAKEK